MSFDEELNDFEKDLTELIIKIDEMLSRYQLPNDALGLNEKLEKLREAKRIINDLEE